MNQNEHTQTDERRANLYQVGKWGAIAIIVYYLLADHRAHVLQLLPYLLLLACPFMHIFMHGKHSSHHHSHDYKKGDQP